MHARIANKRFPFLSRWQGKRSGHPRRMRNLQIYVSGKSPIRMAADSANCKVNLRCGWVLIAIFCWTILLTTIPGTVNWTCCNGTLIFQINMSSTAAFPFWTYEFYIKHLKLADMSEKIDAIINSLLLFSKEGLEWYGCNRVKLRYNVVQFIRYFTRHCDNSGRKWIGF